MVNQINTKPVLKLPTGIHPNPEKSSVEGSKGRASSLGRGSGRGRDRPLAIKRFLLAIVKHADRTEISSAIR